MMMIMLVRKNDNDDEYNGDYVGQKDDNDDEYNVDNVCQKG